METIKETYVSGDKSRPIYPEDVRICFDEKKVSTFIDCTDALKFASGTVKKTKAISAFDRLKEL